MKTLICTLLLLINCQAVFSQRESNENYAIIKGKVLFLDLNSKSTEFHTFLIDSSKKIVSYNWASKINDFEIYHEIKLTTGIEKYILLISDNENNKGLIEYYYRIKNNNDTLQIGNKVKIIFDPPTILNYKKYKTYKKNNPRLRGNFDSERHKIKIKIY